MALTHTRIDDTAVGDVTVVADDDAIVAVHLGPPPPTTTVGRRDDVALRSAHDQLAAYFAGEAVTFDLPLWLQGSAFQVRVWEQLCEIPYGETRSYLDIALALGDRDLVRAVGAANGANPIAIVVPCHRVVGSDGSLVGYAGGLHRKRTLLDLEAGVATLFA
jgi:methylated-DNA-[protein]-cysteine S-methyltransferase